MGHLHGRLIAFDLDGTLVDSRRDLADSANQLIVELGGRPLPEEAIGRMVGEGAALLVAHALAAAGLPNPPSALPRFLEIYDTCLLRHTRPYDGVEAAVRHARRGAYVAVLTNKPLRATELILEGLGLRPLFDEVVGGDGPYPRKPDPASLRALMEHAGASPGVSLLVGDSLIDHETARRGGTRCCMATYGYGYLTFPEDRAGGDEWRVAAPAELPGVFDRFMAS